MATFRFVQRIREGRPILVYGDGNQSRDFTYIDDVAEGTIAALRPLGYEVINLGGDKPHRLMDLIRLIEERFGRQAIIEYSDRHSADVQATWANIDKAKGILQWEPHTGLERGVDLTATWYESERSWARDIPTD
jgi:nucleoside-diphosphate-sugar epimerase